MSPRTPPIASPSTAAKPGPEARPGGPAAGPRWAWMALACLLLAASGAVRAWQDDRFGAGRAANESAPFPLKELPRAMGDWAATSDADGVLDPEVARIAGSADHLIRTYVNKATGAEVKLLVLFGNATEVA